MQSLFLTNSSDYQREKLVETTTEKKTGNNHMKEVKERKEKTERWINNKKEEDRNEKTGAKAKRS